MIKIVKLYIHPDYTSEGTRNDYWLLEIEGKNFKNEEDAPVTWESVIGDFLFLVQGEMTPQDYFEGDVREKKTQREEKED